MIYLLRLTKQGQNEQLLGLNVRKTFQLKKKPGFKKHITLEWRTCHLVAH